MALLSNRTLLESVVVSLNLVVGPHNQRQTLTRTQHAAVTISGRAVEPTLSAAEQASEYPNPAQRAVIPFWEQHYQTPRTLSIVEDMRYALAHLPVSLKYKRMLLSVLRRHHPDWPKDPRTLLFTPRTTTCKAIAGGVYVHIGLRIGLRKAWLTANMCSELRRLNVVLNIDGVSLHGSSRKQIWPILATASE
ncbi:hypothetical protein CLF_102419 [Clonorchis sinensis]|uniref:Uncharacterized protein n=1 Tax=Clonorchis sinensis TaxID=79923 RepID=G7Y7W3_CLOSI|nr:hypothetical protein CLF_102419 [Clonorchis sinensis]